MGGIIYEQEMAEYERRRMNPTLQEIEEELDELEQRKKELKAIYEKKCNAVIMEAIKKSTQEKKIKRPTENSKIILINYSDLIGNPWNYEFYDWYASKDILLEYLSKKPIENWRESIEKLVESEKNGVVYVPMKRLCYEYYTKRQITISEKTPISLEFLKSVLSNL